MEGINARIGSCHSTTCNASVKGLGYFRTNAVVLDFNPALSISCIIELIVGFPLKNFQQIQVIRTIIGFWYSITGTSVRGSVFVSINAVILVSIPRFGIFSTIVYYCLVPFVLIRYVSLICNPVLLSGFRFGYFQVKTS